MKTPLLDGIKKSADVSLPVLAKILNSNFSPPFMPKDYVRAKANNRGELALYIGNRDVSIDKDGKVTGSGSLLVGGWKKPEKTYDHPGLLDGISKKAKKKHVRPLRGTGKTTGMFRRINNLQQGIHYGKKKVEEFPQRLSIYEGITKRANVERLKKKYGITKTERVKSGGYMHTIGFSPKNQKFYGWSHRAVYGFGIGSKVKKGDSGFIPSNKDEFMKSLKKWYSKKVELTEVPGGVKVNEGEYSHIEHYPKPWGKGEYTAKTLEDAKQMAADFAESVS